MVFCPKCGGQIEPGQLFCDDCGSPLDQPAPPPPIPSSPRVPYPPQAMPPSPLPPVPPPIYPPVPPIPPAAAGFVVTPKIIIGIVAVIIIIAAVVFFVLPSTSSSSKTRSGAGSSGGSGLSAPGTMTQCAGSLFLCNGYCVDLQTDSSNCGACGIAVQSGKTCQNGQIVSGSGSSPSVNYGSVSTPSTTLPVITSPPPTLPATTAPACPSGQSECNGACRNLQYDNINCGACDVTCPSGQSCQNGQCIAAYSPPPPTTVPQTTLPLTTAPIPTPGCPAGQSLCGASCKYLLTDPANCGSCGHVCPLHEFCTNGQCVCTGASYWMECSGVCTNVHQDNNNCGACGRVCPATIPNGQTHCDSGSCMISCNPDGHLNCNQNIADGCEVYVMNDVNNCGNCGIRCPLHYSCIKGSCLIPK